MILRNKFIPLPLFTHSGTLLWLLIAFGFSSCSKDDDGPAPLPAGYDGGKGFYVINEGNFGGGNGSLTYFSDQQNKSYQDVFRSVNGNILGDTPTDMVLFNDSAAICVNVSGKVELVYLPTMQRIGSVENLPSPRKVLSIGKNLYVSDLSTGVIHIINKASMQKSGEILTGRAVEQMVWNGEYLYAACWSNFFVSGNNNAILKIDVGMSVVIDSLVLTREPNSLVLEGTQALWVLCSGGYLYEEVPALYRIDLGTFSVDRRMDFVQGTDYPSALCANGGSLFYLNGGSVWKLDPASTSLPSSPFFSGGSYLYNLGADPDGSRVIVTDARDFQSRGAIFVLDQAGSLVHSMEGGIAPSVIRFRDTD